MAVSTRVASRYAKSLIELATEKGDVEAVKEDMEAFSKLVDESRDFELMLNSPLISHDKKLLILNKIFGGKVSKITDAFFTLITKKNREGALDAIAKQFIVQYNTQKGIQPAMISTAIPLNDSLKKEFSNVVSKALNKDVQLTETVNEDLIGGYILRVEDRQIDQSMRSLLINLKKRFKQNSK